MGPRQKVDGLCKGFEFEGLVWVARFADEFNSARLVPLFLNEDAAMLVFRKQLAQRVLRAWIARRLLWAALMGAAAALRSQAPELTRSLTPVLTFWIM